MRDNDQTMSFFFCNDVFSGGGKKWILTLVTGEPMEGIEEKKTLRQTSG